ncbi:3-oxo-tetronate kinase [Labrys sp. KB_33_2]|uniref:3-oxo-tetronate kinase n=1 Tax=Labrys sp. KB_33_2 TaxID=3237479 RepID=UPI003F92AB2B
MLLGAFGDDFTGASDLANTLARAGMRTSLTLGIPAGTAPAGDDAVVVALKSRSIDPAEAVRLSLSATAWLKANGARQILFKYCSTFDSTPSGNIGPVAESVLAVLNAPLALVCPAFPGTGRTLYQGHLFVHDRLLSESGMERHPLTPMTDPDIRRWLQLQTPLKVGHLPHAVVRAGISSIRTALAHAAGRGERLIVADATSNEDLLALGASLADHAFITGASGIAMGLPANYGIAPGRTTPAFAGADGPAVILSGSCSEATRRQVGLYAQNHPHMAIEADAVMNGSLGLDTLVDFLEAHRDAAPMLYSSADPEVVASAQARHGREALAQRIEGLFAELARAALKHGFTRIVAAGGETSGAVAGTLGNAVLAIGPEIDPGVPALQLRGTKPVAIALKSGNFGAPDFFAKAVALLAGKA